MIPEQTVNVDRLEPWQQPILDRIRAEFAGAKAAFFPPAVGSTDLIVLWKGFFGHTTAKRHKMVRSAIDTLGPNASRRIVMLITLMPEEAEDLDDYTGT